MAITNFASQVYGANGGGVLVPRQKFNFSLVISEQESSKVFHQVQNATTASFSTDSVVLNQYNKKRVVQTRLNYDPITVTFYDTFDNAFHNIMTRYMKHYFNGDNGIDVRTTLEGDSVVNPSFTTDLGFTPNDVRYFFPTIEIVQNGYQAQHRRTILKNPIITQVQGDTLDYSDSNPVVYTVTFQPESVQVVNEVSQFDDQLVRRNIDP